MRSEEMLLEASKSAILSAALQSVAEAEINGEAKFSPLVCREIGKYIVCRTYATPILELCHLIVAANELCEGNGRYEYFFWDSGVAHTTSFRAYALSADENYSGDLLTCEKGGVTLQYEKSPFLIHFSRMPVLSALLEFLLSAIGYCEIDEPVQDMLADPNPKTVSACAATLSKTLYAYLKDHLPSAQSQRKFRIILDECQNNADAIDDAFVLNFWKSASLNEDSNSDFKTFSSAFQSCVRMIQALEAAKDLNALSHAKTIGGDREGGEIDPDILSEQIETVQERACALDQLNSTPIDKVKFLNKQESNSIETLLETGDVSIRLPLSVLRTDTFKGAQSRLTQALRRQADPQELQNIIDEGPEHSYEDIKTVYQDIIHHIERVNLASLHALSTARSNAMIELLLRLRPGLDYSKLSSYLIEDTSDTVVTLQDQRIAERFLDILHDPNSVGADISNLLKEAQASYKGLSRKGFKEDLAENPELIDAFSQGSDLLWQVSNNIDTFLKQGWQPDNMHHQFEQDCQEFQSQFSKIYGAA